MRRDHVPEINIWIGLQDLGDIVRVRCTLLQVFVVFQIRKSVILVAPCQSIVLVVAENSVEDDVFIA